MNDDIIIKVLYEDYQTAYWCMKDDLRKYESNKEEYDYLIEDIDYHDRLLQSIAFVLKYYEGNNVVEIKLAEIVKKIDSSFESMKAKKLIANMGNNVTGME